MTSNYLPDRLLGGLQIPPSTEPARTSRAVSRYQNAGSLALQREHIDLECSFYAALHGLALENMLTDVGRVAAGGDPLKQQLAALKIATFAETNNARLVKRWGGVR